MTLASKTVAVQHVTPHIILLWAPPKFHLKLSYTCISTRKARATPVGISTPSPVMPAYGSCLKACFKRSWERATHWLSGGVMLCVRHGLHNSPTHMTSQPSLHGVSDTQVINDRLYWQSSDLHCCLCLDPSKRHAYLSHQVRSGVSQAPCDCCSWLAHLVEQHTPLTTLYTAV